MTEAPAQRRAEHLMVPGQPHRPSGSMSVTTVQRWIMSSLALVTVEHLAAGIVVAAVFLDRSRTGDKIGLLVIATVLATGGILAFRLIRGKRPFSLWLLLAALPATVGAWFCFWR